MIGPHQGKELELMLTGEKHLAVFHDVIPDDHDISEEIIPEQAFAPYVQQGKIKRFSSEIYLEKYKKTVRYVCFALLCLAKSGARSFSCGKPESDLVAKFLPTMHVTSLPAGC